MKNKIMTVWMKQIIANGIYLSPRMILEELARNPKMTDQILKDVRLYRKINGIRGRNPHSKLGISFTYDDQEEVIKLICKQKISQVEGSLILGCSPPTMRNILATEDSEANASRVISLAKAFCKKIDENGGKYHLSLNIHDKLDGFSFDIDCNISNYNPTIEENLEIDADFDPYEDDDEDADFDPYEDDPYDDDDDDFEPYEDNMDGDNDNPYRQKKGVKKS